MTEPEQKKRARGITSSRLILPNDILLGEVKKYVRLGSHVTIRTKGTACKITIHRLDRDGYGYDTEEDGYEYDGHRYTIGTDRDGWPIAWEKA